MAGGTDGGGSPADGAANGKQAESSPTLLPRVAGILVVPV